MMHVFTRLERLIDRLCAGVAILGGLGLVFATVVTCVSICGKLVRRGIDGIFGASNAPEVLDWINPILGEEELVQFGVGFALFAALPYVMWHRGHIKVDLFERFFSSRVNQVLDLIGDILLFLIAYLLMTRQWFLIFKPARRDDPLWGELFVTGRWAEIWDRLRDSQESQIIGIKLWPTYVVAETLTVIFFVVALACVCRGFGRLAGRSPRDA
ncbi:Tripartite ATP-independent transporter, DctQ component [Cognatiyoonia koreensis]|uniref:TRAP transporter small permease protein n=1 Tax=Cognatiyoonia koreensis TaxID=364200 RepID=A0A1I0P688_9RHOB|nr:TRAP transporter small permease subunit [Cognatiyoonia koreensis]SEW09694.1 Tripartite ATP-independent transporter, DctQ component [Cognatiyoonia koreensis]